MSQSRIQFSSWETCAETNESAIPRVHFHRGTGFRKRLKLEARQGFLEEKTEPTGERVEVKESGLVSNWG